MKDSLRWATVPGRIPGEGRYVLGGCRLGVPSVPARARPLTFGVLPGVDGRDMRAMESDLWCVLAADAGRDDIEPERAWLNCGIRLLAGV